MTPKKYSLSCRAGAEHGHVITATSTVSCSEHLDKDGKYMDSIKIDSWMLYMRNSIYPKTRWDYRDRSAQYDGKHKVYRTKNERRRQGVSAATLLNTHEEDMRDNPESLSLEFMQKWIEDFKREDPR